MNQALEALLAKHAFRGPPYPTSLDLMAELQRVTPPEHRYLLTDLLETITLFENRAVSAQATADRGRAVRGEARGDGQEGARRRARHRVRDPARPSRSTSA